MALTAERLRSLFHYDHATGLFTRLVTVYSNAKAGQIAGCMSDGYLLIQIDGRLYKAHRLAFLYVHGRWPRGDLDHINRNRSDNRITNLREATRSSNMHNAGPHRDNTSGFKGVTFNRQTGKWKAQIGVQGKNRYLGEFITAEDAAKAYDAEAKRLHHSFAKTNF